MERAAGGGGGDVATLLEGQGRGEDRSGRVSSATKLARRRQPRRSRHAPLDAPTPPPPPPPPPNPTQPETSFCWGGWFAAHASSLSGFSCAVSFHPSLQVCQMHSEDQAEVVSAVKCPQMLLAAGNDKPEGEVGEVVGSDGHRYTTHPHHSQGRRNCSDNVRGSDVGRRMRLQGM